MATIRHWYSEAIEAVLDGSPNPRTTMIAFLAVEGLRVLEYLGLHTVPIEQRQANPARHRHSGCRAFGPSAGFGNVQLNAAISHQFIQHDANPRPARNLVTAKQPRRRTAGSRFSLYRFRGRSAGGLVHATDAVSIIEVKAEKLLVVNELPGRVAPTRIAEVRPRISGIVVERVFEQGSVRSRRAIVLYRHRRRRRSAFRMAERRGDAEARRGRRRSRPGSNTTGIEPSRASAEHRQRRSNRRRAVAAAGAGRCRRRRRGGAASTTVEAHPAYTETVASPISWPYSAARMITEGALGRAPAPRASLATIQQLDPDLRRLHPAGRRYMPAAAQRASRSAPADHLTRRRRGKFRAVLRRRRRLYPAAAAGSSSSPRPPVDASYRPGGLRGEFPQPRRPDLLPGMYVRVQYRAGHRGGGCSPSRSRPCSATRRASPTS